MGRCEIEGLTIKGRPATPKDLISHNAPDGLMAEVAEELRTRADLSELKKNILIALYWRRTVAGDPAYTCSTCRDQGHFGSRNCTKYFKDQLKPGYRWTPEFAIGEDELPVLIPDRHLSVCPTAVIDPVAISYVDDYYRIKSAGKASNSPYFSSMAEADPRTISAFDVIESENTHIELEVKRALRNRPPKHR